MKKGIIYLMVLGVGLALGALLFGEQEQNSSANQDNIHDHQTMWTCSMHPQIMNSEPGACPLCGMDLIPAESGYDETNALQIQLTKNAVALSGIQTEVVGMAVNSDVTIDLSGKIVANQETDLVQASYFNGRIETLYVNTTGEEISKGQLLATIYAPDLIKAQQELLTTLVVKENQPELYAAVRNKLKLLKLTEAQINAIEKSKAIQEVIPIYASVSGVIINKLVNQGDYIKSGQPLFKLSDLNTVWANFDIYEDQIKHIKQGQAITVYSNSYPGELLQSKIAFIDPVMHLENRTVSMRVVIDNKEGKFKTGMFVKGSVKISEPKDQDNLWIPNSAVLWTGKRSVVYIKVSKEEPLFEMREVNLGYQRGEYSNVLKGLKKGDELVTNGVFTIDASAQLAGKKSMMNHDKILTEPFVVSKEFKKELQKIYNSYIKLKDALVGSDIEAAQIASKNLFELTSNLDLSTLVDKESKSYWEILSNTIKRKSEGIGNSKTISDQRKQFKTLSNHIIDAVQSFGIIEQSYLLYCPMADDNKGAYWLSKEEQILNPFFGDMMLKCGELKETINYK